MTEPVRRSQAWYAGTDRNAFIHRAWMRRGLPSDAFDGRPHIAIANTASDLTPCNMHLSDVAAKVRDGIWEAGGVPLEMPVMSLGETQMRPTAMLFRNLAAMSIEEMIRANPVDGVVLLGGCDKTIPALLMAAASVDLPALVVPGGPMLTGHFRGAPLGCGTDVWKLSEEVRAGTLTQQSFLAAESSMIRSRGHCNTMGTASTMACIVEALGMTLPGTAGTPAPDSRLLERAHECGRLIVSMVGEDRRPSSVLTRGSFLNAIVALAAIGGSTNAVVHLLAIAGRLGVDLRLDDFDHTGANVPLLVDLQPAGRYLMDDMFRAGGLLAVLREVQDLLGRLRYASLIWTTGLVPELARPLLELALREPGRLPRSAILCTAVLGEPINAFETAAEFGHTINDSDRMADASWAWPLGEIEVLAPPVEARGAQGFWEWRG